MPRGINLQNTFVGLGNYISLLREPVFWATHRATFYFTVVSVGLELVLGLAIAQLIHAHPPGWQFLRTSLIIPWAVPTIVNGTMWRWIYNADYGALNGLLLQLGLIDKYIPWLTKPDYGDEPRHPGGYLAQRSLYRPDLASRPGHASRRPGRGRRRGRRHRLSVFLVHPPALLRPAILVALVIRTVEAFRAFDIIYVITNGGPAYGTVTISFLTYLEMFSFGHAGRGSALSFLISLFTLDSGVHLYPHVISPRGKTVKKNSARHPAFGSGPAGFAFYLRARGMAGHLQYFLPFRIAVNTHPLDPAAPHLSKLHQYPLPIARHI